MTTSKPVHTMKGSKASPKSGSKKRKLPNSETAVIEEDPALAAKRNLRGRSKSGRVPRDPKDRKHNMVQGKAFHSSWNKKMERKRQLERVRELEAEIQQVKEAAAEAARKKREEKRRRKEINEKRAELVVPLNPKRLRQKMKTMSKKQLRQIRKADTDALRNKAK